MERPEIKYLPINELVINPDNPRLIRDVGYKRLVKSLKDCPELFDVRPCICSNRTGQNVILGGNMRYMAAKELKYKKVPTIIMDGLTPEQEREITIKDNGTEFGEWNLDLLSATWDDLPLVEWGVDLPESWNETPDNHEERPDDIVPDKDSNILVRLSFHPGIWLGKREEVISIAEKLKKTYGCDVRIEE